MIKEFIEKQKCISAHEHIGSLISFGTRKDPLFPSDVVPSLLPGNTGLVELIFSPYLAGLIFDTGLQFPLPEETEGEKKKEYFKKLMTAFRKNAGTGVYAALDEAFRDLYGFDVECDCENEEKILKLDDDIKNNYASYFRWFKTVMEKSGTSKFLKPVHPEFMTRMLAGEKGPELEYAEPIMRVDSLIGFPDREKVLDFGGIYEAFGVKITDAESADEGIKRFFEICDESKCVSIKQLQAYYRHMNINYTGYDEVKKGFENIEKAKAKGEKPGKETVHLVQDYMMKRILEEADKREISYQIHTGMTNLRNSDPALLEGIIKKYRNVKFTLLHTYPFHSKVCYLARTYKNVYLDTSWQALQSEAILKKCLEEWIGMVPYYRITASIDATGIEDYYGGIKITRRVLSDVLEEKISSGQISFDTAQKIAEGLLYKNASQIYYGGEI